MRNSESNPARWPNLEKRESASAKDYFANNSGVEATTIGGNNPLIIFFRPNPIAIDMTLNGANAQTESVIWHEALHGFTNLSDTELEEDLVGNNNQASDVINEYIKKNGVRMRRQLRIR